MENNKKKRIKKYIAWACAVVLVAFLAVMPLLAGTEEDVSGPQASILSGSAEKRNIDSVLLGGGTLTAEEAEAITIPSAVKLTEFLVGNGDAVSEGDAIASVDRVSVMTAIAQVQETMDYLAEAIQEAAEDSVSESVTAEAGGIVKILYAEEGDSVQDVMLEHGALAVLSLDGLMTVTLERNSDVVSGDSVTVTLSDETETTGRVESNLNGIIVVTVEDEGYAVGERVYVSTEDGSRLGSGELYIHSPWNAVAYSGTVSDVHVEVDQSVSAGKKLLSLDETGYTAQYQQLVSQRREYEEMMLELFEMYQSIVITAPCSGVVSGIDENSAQLLSAEGQTWTISLLSNSPRGDDENQYHNFIGQVTAVGIDGLILKMSSEDLEITDYKVLSGIAVNPEVLTEEVIYSGDALIYELVEDQWVQVAAEEIMEGDVLLFSCDDDGNFVWVIRVPREQPEGMPQDGPAEETPTEPAQPDTPAEPEATEPQATQPQETEPESTEPEATEPAQTPTVPDQSGVTDAQQNLGGQSIVSGNSYSGIIGGFTQGSTEEESFAVYSLETVTVASVTAQDEMTLEVSVDEMDMAAIAPGREVTVYVDVLKDETYSGIITAVGNDGTSNGGSSKFTVEVTLPRSENMLSGMNASVSLLLGTTADVVAVPVAALVENGTQTVIYTGCDEEGNLTGPVAVTLGVSDGEYVQILSGLAEGDTFYYAYYDTLEISGNVAASGFSFG